MPRVRTKLCGMMTPADARLAANLGADAIGIILHAEARRHVTLDIAGQIVAGLPPYVTAVGVFVNAAPTTVLHIADSLQITTVQFHGNESPADVAASRPLRVIKAIKVDASIETMLADWREAYSSGRCDNLIALLLETSAIGHAGGTGVPNDFSRIEQLQHSGAFDGLPPIVISGGLTPENVGDVITRLRPYGVDVSSGIEATFGKKSLDKMRTFVETATAASW